MAEILAYEKQHGFDQAETFRRYGPKINACRDAVLEALRVYRDQGKLIVGYGAAPAITTLIYQFELAPFLKAIVDDNPRKHGRFSPGYKIPILPSTALAEMKPACVVVLAWTYADRIIANNSSIAQWGGEFLVPLPELRIVR